MPRDISIGKKYIGIPLSERKGKHIEAPEISAQYYLASMDKMIEKCDMSLFSIFMANVFSNAERAFCKGNIKKGEMVSLKESAAFKMTEFLKNCECSKKVK